MMNSRFYSLFITIFISSCLYKSVIYNEVDYKGEIFYESIKQKKTGAFFFPKMNFSYSLQKGKLHGKMLLMNKNDTVVFGNFKKNQPIGKYISRLYECDQCKYIFRGTPIDKIYGEGFFDKNSKKSGYWKEYTQEGYYILGRKNGFWRISESTDLENYKDTMKEILYRNDSIVIK